MSTQTIPVTEAKNKLTNLIKNIRQLWDRVIITRNGRNEAVILSYDEYESWLETISLGEDEKDAILKGRKAVEKHQETALDDLL